MGNKKQRNKGKDKFIFPSQIEQYAFHEAGHAIMYLALGLSFDYVTIEPGKTDSMSHTKDGALYQTCGQIVIKEPQEMDPHQLILTSLAGPYTEDIRCRRRPEMRPKLESIEDFSLAIKAAKHEHTDPEAVSDYLNNLGNETIDILMRHKVAVVSLALTIVKKKTVSYDDAKHIFQNSEIDAPGPQGSTISNG